MNSEQEILFDAIADWKSNDDWQFADKEAAWKFFFQAGAASRDAEVAESLVLGDPLYKKGFEAGRQAEREECVGIYKSLLNLYLDRGYPEQQMAFLLAAIDDFIAAIRARRTE